MLTLQVADLEALRRHILPLVDISFFAEFKFSRTTVSLTVIRPHNTSTLTVQIQFSEPFFTLLSIPETSPREFHSCIQLDAFFLSICVSGTDDRLLTILLPDDHSLTHLIFTSAAGHVRFLAALTMAPPVNMYVGKMDERAFVAIETDRFREIAIKLAAFNTRIWVIASASQVKFTVGIQQFTVAAEGIRCKVGGCAFGAGAEFTVTLIPLDFFVQASYLSKMVWFRRSSDRHTIVEFPTGHWTKIVAYNPLDYWEDL